MTQTITGLFDSRHDAEIAVQDLEAAGVSHNDISLVAHGATTGTSETATEDGADRGSHAVEDAEKGAGIGAAVGGLGGLLAGLGLLAIPGLGPVVAAGWLASTVIGAVAGGVVGGAAGGLVGALTKEGVPEEDAHVYAEGVRRGGAVVSAKVAEEHVPIVAAILHGEHGVDLPTRRSLYQQDGWTRFDETAAPYTSDEVAAERARYGRV